MSGLNGRDRPILESTAGYRDFDSNDELCSAMEIDAGAHRVHELPPRFDFFRKHESQYK